MKHLLFVVMILSLLFSAVGCSNGLVSHNEDLSGEEIPTLETTPETSSGHEEPENVNSDETDREGQKEPEPSETVPPEIDTPEVEKKEPEIQEVKPPEENQTEIETPEIKPPVIETPEVVPPVDVPPVEPPIIEPPEVEPPIVEPPEIPPEMIPSNDVKIIINELKTEFSSTSKRAEYIEFKVTREGNLNGISVHIMFDARNPFVYYFPDVNVKEGEYITLHLRTLENNCVNELGDNLALSGGNDSCPTARDLWVSGSNKYLRQTDIVYIKDASGKIIDSVVLNENPKITWDKTVSHFAQITEFLFNEGVWESKDGEKPTPLDAVDTSALGSMYKSVCRYEWRANHFNTTDWYVTQTSPSPGLPNI